MARVPCERDLGRWHGVNWDVHDIGTGVGFDERRGQEDGAAAGFHVFEDLLHVADRWPLDRVRAVRTWIDCPGRDPFGARVCPAEYRLVCEIADAEVLAVRQRVHGWERDDERLGIERHEFDALALEW